MLATTFTEFRNQARHYFDLVEAGETVRVLRNGKPIADITPITADAPSWRRCNANPVALAGVEIARLILDQREP